MAMRVLMPLSGADRVTVLGRAERLDPLGAAFVNAIGGNLLDYDDTHLRTVIHPTAPVAPAALALAEQRGLSGAAMLHAFILGAEVECRIGNAVSPGHYARGWHITSTCGVFGAAAASAKLLGLDTQDRRGMRSALPPASPPDWSRTCPARRRTSASATPRATDCSPRCWRNRATPRRRPRSRARSAGRVRWATNQRSRRSTDGLGERWELLKQHLQALSVRDRDARRGRCVPGAAAGSRGDPAEIAEIIVSGDQLLLDRGDRSVPTNGMRGSASITARRSPSCLARQEHGSSRKERCMIPPSSRCAR